MSFALSPALADSGDESQWGMGIEAQSFGFNLAQIGEDGYSPSAMDPPSLREMDSSPMVIHL